MNYRVTNQMISECTRPIYQCCAKDQTLTIIFRELFEQKYNREMEILEFFTPIEELDEELYCIANKFYPIIRNIIHYKYGNFMEPKYQTKVYLVDKYNGNKRDITSIVTSWIKKDNGEYYVTYSHSFVNGKKVKNVHGVTHRADYVSVEEIKL